MSAEEPALEEGGLVPDFLRDPIGLVRRRWRWMAAVAVVGIAAAAAVSSQLEPSYSASATILVTSQSVPEYFVRSTVQEDSLARINAMMGQILTRPKLADLIAKHDLYPDQREQLTMDALVGRVRSDLTVESERAIGRVSRNESASLLRVEFTAHSPKVAADVANDIASLFTAENIRSRSQQARLTTEFLRKELEAAETALRDQEGAITDFKELHRGELPGELETNLGQLERLQLQRQSLVAQIGESTNRLTTLAQTAPESPDQRLMTLRTKLQEELAIRTERHPDVVALRGQIERLEEQLAADGGAPAADPNSNVMVTAERGRLAQLRQQLRSTENRIAELDLRVAGTPKRQEELAALEQKAEVLRENYLGFLRKVKEAELAQNLEAAQYGARFTVLDRAVPPTRPAISRIQFLALGIVLSLGLAVVLGVLLELLDPVLVTTDQVERISDLPVLGSVPHIG